MDGEISWRKAFIVGISWGCGIDSPSTYKDCHNSDGIIDIAFYKCCYLWQIKSGTEKSCVPITKSQFENFPDYYKKLKDEYGVYLRSFDCNSSFIRYAILGLFSLLLLF